MNESGVLESVATGDETCNLKKTSLAHLAIIAVMNPPAEWQDNVGSIPSQFWFIKVFSRMGKM